MASDADKMLCCRYCLSALLVRLAQYLLAICLDVTPVAAADLKSYLTERLTFGDQDRRFVDSIIRGTVEWVRRALSERNIELPVEVDVARLFEHPAYADEFIELIQHLLSRPDEAICLPVALEVFQFDAPSHLGDFPRLKAAAEKGDRLAALVKAFVVRSTPVSKAALDDIGGELRTASRNSSRNSKSESGRSKQLRLGGGG